MFSSLIADSRRLSYPQQKTSRVKTVAEFDKDVKAIQLKVLGDTGSSSEDV